MRHLPVLVSGLRAYRAPSTVTVFSEISETRVELTVGCKISGTRYDARIHRAVSGQDHPTEPDYLAISKLARATIANT